MWVYVNVAMFYMSWQDDGVKFIVNDTTYQFRGTLTVVSADNLASHLIGGYKSLTSSLRKCRFCMATDLTQSVRSFANGYCKCTCGVLYLEYILYVPPVLCSAMQ